MAILYNINCETFRVPKSRKSGMYGEDQSAEVHQFTNIIQQQFTGHQKAIVTESLIHIHPLHGDHGVIYTFWVQT